jgi:chromosome condensin MukBEF MukE localization factor
MNQLPHLQKLFDDLRGGYHLSPEDEPVFSAVAANPEAYAEYFEPLGLKLVRHPRDFFYFEPEPGNALPQSLPGIAVFAYILIDHAANAGQPLEKHLFDHHFLLSELPHLSSDRYAELLRQMEIEGEGKLRQVLRNMENLGFVKRIGDDEFRLLRPFHRILDKCLELSQSRTVAPGQPASEPLS